MKVTKIETEQNPCDLAIEKKRCHFKNRLLRVKRESEKIVIGSTLKIAI